MCRRWTCVHVHVCSDLCLQGQLVGYVDFSQLQSQVKLVFWVRGHSQSLLLEALHNTGKPQKSAFLFHILLLWERRKLDRVEL